jgi:Xaa-Pro aminopeptidase
MGLLNYTTKIDADKTAQEIAKCLSTHGASGILTEYKEGVLASISFKIDLNGQPLGFKLPCDWRPVLKVLMKDVNVPTYTNRYSKIKKDRELQAVRTAWRIVKDWVEAQMALVETQMVTTQEVFLPYAVMRDGRTLSEHVASDPQMLLGESKQG